MIEQNTERLFFADNAQTSNTDTGVDIFSASDAGKEIGYSSTTIKRLAQELRLPVLATKSGIYIYTRPMLTKIRAELERRKAEGNR